MRLPRVVGWAATLWVRAVSIRSRHCSERSRKRRKRGDGLVADDEQRAVDLELLDVFRQVAGGHALVDLLVAGEVVELLDARLHVVAGHSFARHDGGEIDLSFTRS